MEGKIDTRFINKDNNFVWHPMAETKDGTMLFTDSGEYGVSAIERCYLQFFLWANMGYKIKHAWIDVYYHGEKGKPIDFYKEA